MLKKLLKMLLPPIVLEIYRKANEPKYFSGVYENFNQVPDGNPWSNPEWISLNTKNLERYLNIEEERTNRFMPEPLLEGYLTLPCLMVNLLSQKECKVLDFAGGNGFIYYVIRPYLFNKKNIFWYVVDNAALADIGKKYKKEDDNIFYNTELPENQNQIFDIVFISSALQYISNYKMVLMNLLAYRPIYLMLTNLISGDIPDFVTCQNIYGTETPCQFLNFRNLVNFLSDNNYDLIYKAPCNESFVGKYNKNIPEELQIPFTINLIFRKSG
jgi:putative methyltransferase (TIGR04325 family)